MGSARSGLRTGTGPALSSTCPTLCSLNPRPGAMDRECHCCISAWARELWAAPRLCSSADGACSADWARLLWPFLPASHCQRAPRLQPPCGATCSAACTCPSVAAPLCDPRDAKCKPECGDYWACTPDCVCPSATHVCDLITTACRPLCGAACDSSCGCPLNKPACWGGTCKVHMCRGRDALPTCGAYCTAHTHATAVLHVLLCCCAVQP